MPEFAQAAWLWLLLAAPLILLLPVWLWPGGISKGRFKRIGGSLLRCLALAALVIALAGPLVGSYSRHTDVVFALDVSKSIDRETAAEALSFIQYAWAAKEPAARMGLVVFGADAALDVLVRSDSEPAADISAHIERSATNIGRALEVAIGAFPPGEHRRIVLLSDGQENLGDARPTVAAARSIGVELMTIPLERAQARDEVRVDHMTAPPWVHVHEPFTVQMTLHSRQSVPAHLVILRNGAVLRQTDLTLNPGTHAFSIVDQVSRGGLYEYEVIVNSTQDGVQENNRYQAFVQAKGAPRVLHVLAGEPNSVQGRYFSEALRAQGLLVDDVATVPANRHQLTDYDLVVLNNVSGFDLSLAKMELLEDYVRDAGGGLISLGGDKSYGAGGYYNTPVERLLPVTMDLQSELKMPSLAVIIVLDKSGSMSSASQGEQKVLLAKRAALAAVEVLNARDRVGVLAFDAKPEWIVPPTEVVHRQQIANKLRALGVGGGTHLLPALQEAYRAMQQEQAKLKHLIVLSDGLTGATADFDELSQRIAADGMTISTVALGKDADQALMARIAAQGGGRYYYTDHPQNIPRIFTSEAMLVSRDLVVEQTTRPRLVYPGEITKGFRSDSFPLLHGYQRTFAKPAAQVLLAAADEGGDPLLVSWRYGLGKSVAFMSDLAGRWGQQWVSWSEFNRFAAQLARWTLRRSGDEHLLPTFKWRGQQGEILIDALDRDERFINGLALQANIVDPKRNTHQIGLKQIAPGRYRGEFPLPSTGRYYVNLSGSAGETSVGPKTFGLAVPYSSEYVKFGANREFLSELAAATGGRMLPLSSASLAAILASKPGAISERWRLWRPLLLSALVLLVLEVALRKIRLPELKWARTRQQRSQPNESDYESLWANLAQMREQHLAALANKPDDGMENPATRARLYLTGRNNTGR